MIAPGQGSESQTLQTYLLPNDGPVGLISVYGDREKQCLVVELLRIEVAPWVDIKSQKFVFQASEAEELLSEMVKIVDVLKNGDNLF